MIKKYFSKIAIKRMTRAHLDGCDCIVTLIKNYQAYHTTSPIKILDLGCGIGFMAKLIFKNCASQKIQYYGIDIVDGKKVPSEIFYQKQNLEHDDLPYPNADFDIVFANQVIEHVLHKDHMLEEAYRVLKKYGLFVCATENIASLDNTISLLFGQEPLVQTTSMKYYTTSFISPHFMKPMEQENIDGNIPNFHTQHKNVCSYYGLMRLLQINGFDNPKIKSFGHLNRLFEKLFPIQNRVIVAYATK